MSELNKIVGARLQQCRKERDWTLEQVSNQIGATLQQYSNWERGIRPVSLIYLHKLAALYSKNGGWLSGFDEQQTDTKGPTITINDTLMDNDLIKGDEVQIDSSVTVPSTTDMFAIKVNDQVWVRWIRPELDGSYTIRAVDAKHWPEMKVGSLDELKKLEIIGRVHCIKRHI